VPVDDRPDAARRSSGGPPSRPAPVEAGARGDVLIDVAAFGRFGRCRPLFRQVALSAALMTWRSLTLSATSEACSS